LRYNTYCDLKEKGVIKGKDGTEIEQSMIAQQAQYKQINEDRDWSTITTNTELALHESAPTNERKEQIPNNITNKTTNNVNMTEHGLERMSMEDANDLLIAHEAIHQHHEQRLSEVNDRRALAAGKMLQLRLKARQVRLPTLQNMFLFFVDIV